MSREAMETATRTSSGRIIPISATRAVYDWTAAPARIVGYRAMPPVFGPLRDTREAAMADAVAYYEARDAS